MGSEPKFHPHGQHLIAGHWHAGEGQFTSAPVDGQGNAVSKGSTALVRPMRIGSNR